MPRLGKKIIAAIFVVVILKNVKIVILKDPRFLIPRNFSLEAFGYGRSLYVVVAIDTVMAAEMAEVNARCQAFKVNEKLNGARRHRWAYLCVYFKQKFLYNRVR